MTHLWNVVGVGGRGEGPDQNILRLQVSVDNVVAVEVFQRFSNLCKQERLLSNKYRQTDEPKLDVNTVLSMWQLVKLVA